MNIVIVLGKRLNDDSTMKEELIERLDLGIKTFNETDSSFLAVTGGKPNRKAKVTEASMMYEYLKEHDFDTSKIIVENKSLTTYSNAWRLKRILKHMNIENIYLVSSKYHFFRDKYPKCQKVFKKYFKNVNIINCYNEE